MLVSSMLRSRIPGCKSTNRTSSEMETRSGALAPDRLRLDLADQVERGLERVGAGRPLRGAHFTRMRSDVLRALYLAQQFLRVPADAVVVHFHHFDLALRIDDECAAVGKAILFDEHFEITRERRGRIADQRVLHLLDGVGGVMPGLVREVRIGG